MLNCQTGVSYLEGITTYASLAEVVRRMKVPNGGFVQIMWLVQSLNSMRRHLPGVQTHRLGIVYLQFEGRIEGTVWFMKQTTNIFKNLHIVRQVIICINWCLHVGHLIIIHIVILFLKKSFASEHYKRRYCSEDIQLLRYSYIVGNTT